MRAFFTASASASAGTLCTLIIFSGSILYATAIPNANPSPNPNPDAEPLAKASPAPTPAPEPVALWNLPWFGNNKEKEEEEADQLEDLPRPGIVPVNTITFNDEVIVSYLPLDSYDDKRLLDYCKRHDCEELREEAVKEGWEGGW